MYKWCSAYLPRRLVDTLWVLWYAFLLTLVIFCLDRSLVPIFYLHA